MSSRFSESRRWPNLATLIAAALCLAYAIAFYDSISRFWFHPDWTSDDALQQIYPFHAVHHPELFKGDFITEMMRCYLAPLHYWLGFALTWITGDPIMMGHWMMLIQMVLSVVFLFLAVQHWASSAAAFFAVTWLLHTRLVMQRLTAGLPRGWALPVLTAYLYLISTGRHKAILVLMAIGCLLHPPATVVVGLAYGLTLVWQAIAVRNDRERLVQVLPILKRLVLLTPLYAGLLLYVTHMPEQIGTMATLERAAQMPEFQSPGGRFPFVPLLSIEREMRTFGFQAFVARLYNPGPFLAQWTPLIVLLVLALMGLLAIKIRRVLVPMEIWFMGLATMVIYEASRILAFRLYVPNRHLQLPLAVFFIAAFTVAVWRLCSVVGADQKIRSWRRWLAPLGLVALGGFIWMTSGPGLKGAMNFNYHRQQRGPVFEWVRKHTPESALIAGHPTFIDPVQLFGMRRGYITTETAHPFYDGYYAEVKRRLEIILRAYYAPSLQSMADQLEPEGIDYMVFGRGHFLPEALKTATYYRPFDDLVKELVRVDSFAYNELPDRVDLDATPYLVYVDRRSKIVDLRLLRDYLSARQGDSSPEN